MYAMTTRKELGNVFPHNFYYMDISEMSVETDIVEDRSANAPNPRQQVSMKIPLKTPEFNKQHNKS